MRRIALTAHNSNSGSVFTSQFMSPRDLATVPTATRDNAQSLYREYVNPQWSRLLDVLRMNVGYTRCRGTVLHTDDGREVLDFLSGYCVHNTGHNHPRII